MNGIGTKRLETQRLILRPFTLEDAQAMYENWAGDPDVVTYFSWPVHQSVEDSRKILSNWISMYSDNFFYNWAIVPKEVGVPIGNIEVTHRKDQVNLMEIGYCIGKAYWGKGILTEVLKEVVRFLFEEVGVNRIQARVDPDNKGSEKVLEKCGFQYEATFRQYDLNKLGIRDASYYAILRSDDK